METNIVSNFMTRNRVTFRAIIVGVLSLILLIPAAFIQELVRERKGRLQEVQEEVSSKWSGEQTVTGPIIAVPYVERVTDPDDAKKVRIIQHTAFFLPERLEIKAHINPETRHRSIFQVTVYDSEISMEGSFGPMNFGALHVPTSDIQFDRATVFIGLSDFRGIQDQVTMDRAGQALAFNAGLPANAPIPTGLQSPFALPLTAATETASFRMKIRLRGSDRLYFTPVGKTTEVHMNSTWPAPSFDGEFLPVNPPDISPKGFTADWKVLHLNRNFPQYWRDGEVTSAKGTAGMPPPNPILESAFGVRLYASADGYARTERSVKYALLFIMLTFTLYFFIELFQKKRVHPLQYVLVGIALCVFYLLLLSISEYAGFTPAYAIASLATVSLVTLYTRSVFGQWKVAAIFGGVLGFLYTFIFVLIRMEDGSLLFGSIGLFIVLALVMWFSRKVDWYGRDQ
jgi:inner membrane protein